MFVTANAGDGLGITRERIPRLVVLDSSLGVETEKLLVEIRCGVDTSQIPVVVFGGGATAHERAALTLLGANAYLPKPLILSEVDLVAQELSGAPQSRGSGRFPTHDTPGLALWRHRSATSTTSSSIA